VKKLGLEFVISNFRQRDYKGIYQTKGGPKMRLRDKVAIITAAGSGVGHAGALLFAREGAKVIAGDIDPKGGAETVRIIKDAGGEVSFVKTDVGKVEDVRKLVETAVDIYGKLNILWNHAGIPGPGTLEVTEEVEFDRAMAINVKGGFFATKFAVPLMKKAGSGSIIFTASVSALRASPNSPSYSLTKGGLIPLTLSLAVSLGPYNIRTNCICPAPIYTPMLSVFLDRAGSKGNEFVENAIKALEEKVPMGRLAKAEDVAYAALFLASDDACYINGVILPVDGGWIAR
jgi:NAD(P)-dependent dehydrogenase (short-subunit alcohol dehydrogenase family)